MSVMKNISVHLKLLYFALSQGFPTRGARQHLRGCEMVIQIFVLHFCPVMLSTSGANSSAQSVSNYSMPNARPSIQPETMLISKKKVNTRNFSLDFKIGLHLDQGCHIGYCEIGDDLFFLEIISAIMVRKLRNLPASA